MRHNWQAQGRSTRERRRKKTPPRRPAAPVAKERPAEVVEATRPASTTSGWRTGGRPTTAQTIRPEEYSYVYNDLKRIAILAGSIFAVLIALSFVIK